MKHAFRACLVVALAAGGAALTSVGMTAQNRSDDWQIGDVFAGIGRLRVNPGTYLVFDPEGQPKGTLTDPFAGRTGITTGCMVAPQAAGEALFTTGYFNLGITRFAAAAPHQATRPITLASTFTTSLGTFTIEGNESVVFDANGNYYLGGVAPGRETAADPIPPHGFIFKYSSTHQLLATYVVPNGMRGADEIDLGSDQRTLYYTSEDNKIRSFRPGTGPGDPDQYREITITIAGEPIAGPAYALRALPPVPGSTDQQPSGFLVATGAAVRRIDPSGDVITSYLAPGANGSYFALDITPDAQSFWTATFQADPNARNQPAAGQLVRFHISTGEITAGPIQTSASNIWGLCVKREYTAGINTCYATDGRGNAVLDPSTGRPQTVPCRVPEICSNRIDDDGDGAVDADDTDCRSPGTPVWVQPPDREHWEGDRLAGPTAVHLIATDPQGDQVTFTLTSGQLPAGLTLSPAGTITGTIGYGTAATYPRTLKVTASDGRHAAEATFLWTIRKRNRPPALTNPGPLTLGVDQPVTVPLQVADPDNDSVMATHTLLPAGLSLRGLRFGQPTSDLTALGPGPAYGLVLTGRPTIAGTYAVTVSISDLPDLAPGDAPHQQVLQTFTIIVTNRAPVFAVADQSSPLGVAMAPLTLEGSDPDGHLPLSYQIEGLPAGLVLAGSVISGTPTVAVQDQLVTVTLTDRLGLSSVRTFRWTITDGAANRAPVARGNNYSTPVGSPLLVPAGAGLLGNDRDPDGDTLRVVAVNGVAALVGQRIATPKGSLRVNADGSLAYTPLRTASGTDTFTYRATDGQRESNLATVTVRLVTHTDGDGCDHERRRRDHRDGDDCDHDRQTSSEHREGDGCDHDRHRRGHRDGDDCDHDRRSRGSHDDDDHEEHARRVKGHRDGDGCRHDGERRDGSRPDRGR